MIEFNLDYKYCWIYKFFIYWGDNISISYYPDYETEKWEIKL